MLDKNKAPPSSRELAENCGVRILNENAAYRKARTALLAEEIELRRHIERVAEMRRALPPGAEVIMLYSDPSEEFSRDFGALTKDNGDDAGLHVFTRRDGTLRHFWSGEMDGSTADPGQDPRGAPDLMPLWTVLDCTPEGRRPDWYPKLNYGR